MVKGANYKIKVHARVQLKNDKEAKGLVTSACGRARWNVKWNEGKFVGTETVQSSMSLCLFESNIDKNRKRRAQGVEGGGDVADDDADHQERKEAFDAFAETLEEQQVKVCCE